MESWLISYKEHKIVAKYKRHLETKYLTTITIPNVERKNYSKNDVIFAFISGSPENIKSVKDFITQKMTEESKENEIVISLSSDSDSESSDSSSASPEHLPKKQVATESTLHIPKKENQMLLTNADESVVILSDSELEIDSTSQSKDVSVFKSAPLPVVENKKKRRKTKQSIFGACSSTHLVGFQDVSSTTPDVVPQTKRVKQLDEGVNFLSLDTKSVNFCFTDACLPSTSHQTHDNSEKVQDDSIKVQDDSVIVLDDSVIVLDDPVPNVPKPLPVRRLRPIVIDGSNVARQHGLSTNTFSSRGIQISIEYFLKRGHESVTCFIPNFRRHVRPRPIRTTNPEILEELHLRQLVVFTPNRSYDDRFILNLACETQGVILSNDNFRDLKDTRSDYKEAVEKRLLMFCFVGDMLMPPDDPLGRNGPTLDNFLAFP